MIKYLVLIVAAVAADLLLGLGITMSLVAAATDYVVDQTAQAILP